MFTAAFLQYGFRPVKGSYFHYLPAEDVAEFMSPIIQKAIDGTMDEIAMNYDNTNAFYRNNFYDNDIVPKMRLQVLDKETEEKGSNK